MEEYKVEDIEDFEVIVSLIVDYILDNFTNYEIEEVKGIRKFLRNLDIDTLIKIAKEKNIDVVKR